MRKHKWWQIPPEFLKLPAKDDRLIHHKGTKGCQLVYADFISKEFKIYKKMVAKIIEWNLHYVKRTPNLEYMMEWIE